MSSISHLPYGKVLDYWYEKLEGNKNRTKFLMTKFIEIFTFKPKNISINQDFKFIDFPDGKKHNLPIKAKIGVVVPIYIKSDKNLKDLQNLFQSIFNLEYQPDVVILIDDCSPMNYEYPSHFIQFVQQKNSGPAKARNKGIELALQQKVDIIAFTDSDCILDKEWTKQIIFHFQKDKNCAVVSGNTISFDKNWLGTYHNINGTLNGRKFKASDRLLYGTTANLAITSEVGQQIKFNEQFPNAAGEDIEFCFKANRAGFEIKFNEKAIVNHHYGYTKNFFGNLRKFRRQFIKYAKGERILLEQVPEYYIYFDKTEEINPFR